MSVETVRTKLYLLLHRCGRICEKGATVFFLLGAGILRLSELQKLIQNRWEAFGEQMEGFPDRLFPWEEKFYARFLKPDDHILLVGCGRGRDFFRLLECGFRVDGLDFIPFGTAIAREVTRNRGLKAQIYTTSIEAAELPGSFDVFIFSWFAYGYIAHAQTRGAILRKVKAHLNPGGRILISYILTNNQGSGKAVRLLGIVSRLTRSDWHSENGDCLAPDWEDGRQILYEHRFRRDEIEREANQAGLKVLSHEITDDDEGLVVLTA